MELTGHGGEVFAARFDPTGEHIASGSMDRDIRKPAHPLWSSIRTWTRLTARHSLVAHLGRMRKLRRAVGTQGRGTGLAVVTRFKSRVFCIGRHAPGELGCRDGPEDTEAPGPRRGHQLLGHEQARRRSLDQRVRRWIHWRTSSRVHMPENDADNALLAMGSAAKGRH